MSRSAFPVDRHGMGKRFWRFFPYALQTNAKGAGNETGHILTHTTQSHYFNLNPSACNFKGAILLRTGLSTRSITIIGFKSHLTSHGCVAYHFKRLTHCLVCCALRPLQNAPFCPISVSGSNFNPQNTKCIPVVKFFTFLELAKISIFQRCRSYNVKILSASLTSP